MEAVLTVRMPKSLDEAIVNAAQRHHLDRAAFVRAALSRAAEIGLFALPPNDAENNSDVQEERDESAI